MTIHITHERTTYVGRVHYNFEKVTDIILIVFDKPVNKDNTDLLLRFDESLNRWIDAEGVHNTNPILFAQILNKLDRLLKDHRRMLAENNKNKKSLLS